MPKRETLLVELYDRPRAWGGRQKHLHDVGGALCTHLLAESGPTAEPAVAIMGRAKKRVGEIRKHHVDGAQVIVALGHRIAERAAAKRGARQR